MQVAYLIFSFLVFAITAGACVWLHRRMRSSGVDNPPLGRLMVLIFTYGSGLYVVLSILLFFDDAGAKNIAISNATTLGFLMEIVTSILWVYVILIAPIVVLVIGGVSFLKKGDSIYHRLVYLASAGYAFFVFALFMLMASRCSTPAGGIP